MILGWIIYIAIIAAATALFWFSTHELMFLAVFLYSPFIVLGAIVLGIILMFISKKLLRPYLVGLLVAIGTTVLLPVATQVFFDLAPTRMECRYRMVLEVDTPEGLKTADSTYEVRSNRFRLGSHLVGKRSIVGNDLVLDLGEMSRIRISPQTKQPYKGEPKSVYGFEEYRKNEKFDPIEMVGEHRPKMFLTKDGQAVELKPYSFEEHLGQDIHFRRIWMQITEKS